MPVVAAWAGWQQRRVLAQGEPLDRAACEVAASVGVREPQRIRLLHVERIPFPGGPAVDRLALRWGLRGPQVDGLTLGYAIYLRQGASRTESSHAPLQIALPEGRWRAEWIDPKTGKTLSRATASGGDTVELKIPEFETDVALRIRKR